MVPAHIDFLWPKRARRPQPAHHPLPILAAAINRLVPGQARRVGEKLQAEGHIPAHPCESQALAAPNSAPSSRSAYLGPSKFGLYAGCVKAHRVTGA